jgi:hypothetical protein
MFKWFRRASLRGQLRATLECRQEAIRHLGSYQITEVGRANCLADIAWFDRHIAELRSELKELT